MQPTVRLSSAQSKCVRDRWMRRRNIRQRTLSDATGSCSVFGIQSSIGCGSAIAPHDRNGIGTASSSPALMPARRAVAVAVVVVSAALQPSARGSVLRGAAAEPDLVVEARARPERVVTGRNVTFTVTIGNEGSDSAIDVTLLDELPPETTFVSCAATGSGKCGGSGRERRVTFDAVRPDATETVTLVAAVMCPLADGEELSNTASIHLPRARAAGAAAELDDADDVAIAVVTTSNPPPMVSDLTLTPSRQQTDDRM